jgi:hypothetical protein
MHPIGSSEKSRSRPLTVGGAEDDDSGEIMDDRTLMVVQKKATESMEVAELFWQSGLYFR